jgi:hypothetical protein
MVELTPLDVIRVAFEVYGNYLVADYENQLGVIITVYVNHINTIALYLLYLLLSHSGVWHPFRVKYPNTGG